MWAQSHKKNFRKPGDKYENIKKTNDIKWVTKNAAAFFGRDIARVIKDKSREEGIKEGEIKSTLGMLHKAAQEDKEKEILPFLSPKTLETILKGLEDRNPEVINYLENDPEATGDKAANKLKKRLEDFLQKNQSQVHNN